MRGTRVRWRQVGGASVGHRDVLPARGTHEPTRIRGESRPVWRWMRAWAELAGGSSALFFRPPDTDSSELKSLADFFGMKGFLQNGYDAEGEEVTSLVVAHASAHHNYRMTKS